MSEVFKNIFNIKRPLSRHQVSLMPILISPDSSFHLDPSTLNLDVRYGKPLATVEPNDANKLAYVNQKIMQD
jgi:hypothetical protein